MILGKLPPNQIIETNGCFHFVGNVDTRLAFVADDGRQPTDEQIETARQFGPRLARVRTRTWSSMADAANAARNLGYTILFCDVCNRQCAEAYSLNGGTLCERCYVRHTKAVTA